MNLQVPLLWAQSMMMIDEILAEMLVEEAVLT